MQKCVLNIARRLAGALKRRSIRQLQRYKEVALVLTGQEGRRKLASQQYRQNADNCEKRKTDKGLSDKHS